MSKRLTKAQRLKFIEEIRERWFSVYDETEFEFNERILEMGIKWINYYQLNPKTAYLRAFWDWWVFEMALSAEYTLNTDKYMVLGDIKPTATLGRKINKELEKLDNELQTKKELTLWD